MHNLELGERQRKRRDRDALRKITLTACASSSRERTPILHREEEQEQQPAGSQKVQQQQQLPRLQLLARPSRSAREAEVARTCSKAPRLLPSTTASVRMVPVVSESVALPQ